MVAKRYAQTHDIDYDKIFTPVVKIMTVHVVLVVVVASWWHLHWMDVKNAFSQGNLEEQAYMVKPSDFS